MADQYCNEELREIRARERLTVPEIARLTGASENLARCWVAAPQSAKYRPMRAMYMRLLKLELERRSQSEGMAKAG